MASDVRAVLCDPSPGAASWLERRLETLESRWSRFRADSELSRLNEAFGEPVAVSRDTVTLLECMVRGRRLTGGAFDPAMLRAIVTAGYPGGAVPTADDSTVALSLPTGVDSVSVDRRRGLVVSPPGLALDAGGIGKGLAADLVVDGLLRRGTAGALVSVGGDLAAGGSAPGTDGWAVVIEDPFDRNGSLATFTIDRGGVATSSTRSRTWWVEGQERHHVLDPVTRRPTHGSVAAVTVVAPSGWLAEVHAKAAMMGDVGSAVAYLEDRGLDGSVTGRDGRHVLVGRLASTPPECRDE